jgi:hypothetical protein
MHADAGMVGVWRCNWRPRSSKLRDALHGHDRASLVMHLEAEIDCTERCTFEIMIENIRTCSWRPQSSERQDAPGSCNRESLKIQMETMI